MAAHIDRIKLLVVGDSGVGKSTFVGGIVNQSPHTNLSSTIGCNVEVLEYQYVNNGQQRDVFLEFWEVGGASGHRNSRNIFYANANGLVVVHDLANRKSFLNLQKWVREVLNSGKQELTGITVKSDDRDNPDSDFMGSSGTIPILVLGTKEDQSNVDKFTQKSARHIGLTEDSDVFFCDMNCLQQGQLSSNSTKWNTLHAFFSKVIESRFYPSKKINQEIDYWRTRKKIF